MICLYYLDFDKDMKHWLSDSQPNTADWTIQYSIYDMTLPSAKVREKRLVQYNSEGRGVSVN